MNFMQILNSLDELLYAVMSWLVFYPVTLWRTLRHPLRMMDYADRELADSEAEQFTDTISPPLFLLISILLSHGVELSLIGDSSVLADQHGLAALIDDDTSLIAMRLLIFSVFPLVLAARLVRKQGVGLNRTTLQLPFYSQCYVTAPFALLIGVAATFAQVHADWAGAAAGAILAVALVWYLVVQSFWYARKLKVSIARGFLNALVATLQSLLILLLVLPLFA